MDLKFTPKLSLIYLLVALPSMHAVAANSTYLYNSWSFGAGVGVNTFMGNLSNQTDIGNVASDTEANVYKYGAMGNFFVGLGHVYPNNFYFGTNLGFNFYGNNKLSLRNSSYHYDFITGQFLLVTGGGVALQDSLITSTVVTRNAWQPILDFKPGYVFDATNTLVYGLLGASYNSFEIKTSGRETDVGQLIDPPGEFSSGFYSGAAFTSPFKVKSTKNIWGLRVGAGLEQLITNNLSLSANYVYTFYRSANTDVTRAGSRVACDFVEGCTTTPTNAYLSGSGRVSDQQVMMQLIYHVCG